MGKDEYAYVLEYLPFGLQDSKDRKATAIVLTDSLGLLLVALKKDAKVEPKNATLRLSALAYLL